MDLKDFESTTTYAIEAVYRSYWDLIPEKYRLEKKLQRWEHGVYNSQDYGTQPTGKPQLKRTMGPLTPKDVEKEYSNYNNDDEYSIYMNNLNNEDQYFDLQPFYDPELNFENRLQYKLVGINYPKRKHPWFVITWNCGNGLINSTITRRKFQSAQDVTPGGEKIRFDFTNSELEITMAIYSNSMQALFELQENIVVHNREKAVVWTKLHSILGKFPVSMNAIDSVVTKLPREKGTICTLTLVVKIDYPLIGNVRSAETGVINVINDDIDALYPYQQDETILTLTKGSIPQD